MKKQDLDSIHKILALDLGTTTGWAGYVDGIVTSGTWRFAPGRYEGGGMRFLRFRRQLSEVHELLGPFDAIYFEEVRSHSATGAAHIYGGFMFTLEAWCEAKKIPYQGIPVGTIKKHATGKGNTGKPEMIAAAQARGWNPVDDNEADALWLLDCVIQQNLW